MSARSRRVAGSLAATMAALAIIIAALPLSGEPELAAPMLIPRPIVTAILLAVPAAIASIAVLRRSPMLLVIGGLVAFAQSFVAFSGVTLGFLAPALLLILLGIREDRTSDGPRRSPARLLSGVLVILLSVAAWVVVIGTAETVCWVASLGPDGRPLYRLIPVTDSLSVGVPELGAGCDSGVPMMAGLLAGAVLTVGALALAWLASAEEASVAPGSG